MAGLVDSPTAIAARQSATPAQSRFTRQNLVDASVSLGGRSFATLIREGASAEELIEKVAKENGGGVARVFYPEFNTWEIVAVKIGDELLVKGDPKRVAEADFSAFADPSAMRSAAIHAARDSEGGIHFSLGAAGIPIAVTQDLGVVFPNAEELRVGSSTRNIALWMTSVNADPASLLDLERRYEGKGGISVSDDALSRIAKAHGGVRSEKLMLEENLLVLNKDTGEILTASQFSSSMMRDVAPAPEPAYLANPSIAQTNHAAIAADRSPRQQSMVMDGSPLRQPLVMRTFSQSMMELLTVRFNPLRESAVRADAAIQPPTLPSAPDAAMPASDPVQCPQLPKKAAPGDARPSQQMPMTKNSEAPRTLPTAGGRQEAEIPAPSPHAPPILKTAPALSPQEIRSAWLRPRSERLALPMPPAAERMAVDVPSAADMPERRRKPLPRKDISRIPKPGFGPKKQSAKDHRKTGPGDAKRPGAPLSRKKKDKFAAPSGKSAKTSRTALSPPDKARKASRLDTQESKKPRLPKVKQKPLAAKAPGRVRPETVLARPRETARKSTISRRNVHAKDAEHLSGRPNPKKRLEARPLARRRKAAESYFLNEMLGPFRKKRRRRVNGRTAAGSSG